MATNYSDLVTEVSAGMNGVPSFVATEKIREIVIDFCKRTWAYEHDLSDTLVVDQDDYTLTAPDYTEILSVIKVTDDDADDAALYFTVEHDFSQITMSTTPTEADDITVKVVLSPSNTSTSFPDWVYNRYKDGIVEGARALIYAMPNRPWSSAAEEEKSWKRFKRAVNTCKREINRSRVGVSMVTMRGW